MLKIGNIILIPIKVRTLVNAMMYPPIIAPSDRDRDPTDPNKPRAPLFTVEGTLSEIYAEPMS
jgi:hypothetical protein